MPLWVCVPACVYSVLIETFCWDCVVQNTDDTKFRVFVPAYIRIIVGKDSQLQWSGRENTLCHSGTVRME